jgi:serine/threonine-protein phosphatase 4 regulatory subunit 1
MANHAVNAEAEDARTKVLECLVLFVEHLGNGPQGDEAKDTVANGLVVGWLENVRGWREREVFASTLGGLSSPLALGARPAGREALRRLMMLALTDSMAAVRDKAVAQLPTCFQNFGPSCSDAVELRKELLDLAVSSSFRRRATYVACVQSLILSPLAALELEQNDMWTTLRALATDAITDVRIGTARLASFMARTCLILSRTL